MIEILNKNFAVVFTVENTESIPKNSVASRELTLLEIGSIEEKDLRKYLDKLETNKSTGHGNLSPRLHKELKQEIQQAPYRHLQPDITTTTSPGRLETCQRNTDLQERRQERGPELQASVAGKILAKFIRDRLFKFLEDNNIISDAHLGLRNKRSRLTNLLDFFAIIYENWANHAPSDVIYLEFQKAFDKVPHERLLKKLKSGELGDNLIAWIKDWLSGRNNEFYSMGRPPSGCQ